MDNKLFSKYIYGNKGILFYTVNVDMLQVELNNFGGSVGFEMVWFSLFPNLNRPFRAVTSLGDNSLKVQPVL